MTLDDRDEMAEVHLTVVSNEIEAEMVCRLLRSQGIACRYRKTDVAGAIGAAAMATTGPTEIIVYQRDLEAARELLQRHEPGEPLT
jgi:hypothetical protein